MGFCHANSVQTVLFVDFCTLSCGGETLLCFGFILLHTEHPVLKRASHSERLENPALKHVTSFTLGLIGVLNLSYH